jgi:hypothetical protein
MSNQLYDIPQDHLSLFKKNKPDYEHIVDFLHLKRGDVARATGLSTTSVRYEENRIPKELSEILLQWAVLFNKVAEHFKGDTYKTNLWFNIPNPLLGNVSPKDMIRLGRYKKLYSFVMQSIDENQK